MRRARWRAPDHPEAGAQFATPAGAFDPGFAQFVLHRSQSPGRIQPTRSPKAIGQAPNTGCIQLVTPSMVDLYRRVGVGAHVVVTN
jgi:lipoprotein-anchoring transpeptidase ErfK/SrfK